MFPLRQTKIIATIGPASEDEKILEKLITLGVDGARLNFSHGSHEWHSRMIKLIRKIEKKLDKHIAIIADMQGPKIRVGNLPDTGLTIKTGKKITIDTDALDFKNNKIPLPSSLFKDCVKTDHLVFLDDGAMQIKIIAKQGTVFKAIVLRGGVLFSRRGVNVPDLKINSSVLGAKDKTDAKFAVRHDVDFVALSFIKNAKDITEAKKILKRVKVIAKIEKKEALKNIKEIASASDAVMIARGDLGIETPLWELPIRQKEIIELVKKMGKPAIVATQMLDSMIRNPLPTRAEVSDVANAVFENADAVMLAGETALGKYPLEAVDIMRKILEATDGRQTFCYTNKANLW